jgi:hypothetical protein
MASDQSSAAEAVAIEWNINAELLDEADWELETIDNNDGFPVGYLVRFGSETDRELLDRLGVTPGEYQREVSLNAFETSDEDFKSFPADSPPVRGYLIGDQRFTPSQFRKLSRARKIEAMRQWFLSRYKDPQNETSFSGSDGGYQWVGGGPYDADEELQNEFGDLAEYEVIEAAVDRVQSEGTYEWAPNRGHYSDDDYDRDLRLREGSDDGIYSVEDPFPDITDFDEDDDTDKAKFPDLPPGQSYLTDELGGILTDTPQGVSAVNGAALNEFVINGPAYAGSSFSGSSSATSTDRGSEGAAQPQMESFRVEVIDRLDHLETVVRRSMETAPNRGHNNPPELVEIDRPVTQEQFQELMAAITEIRRETVSPHPQPANIEVQVTVLQRIAGAVKTATVWLLNTAAAGIVGDQAVNSAADNHAQIHDALVRAVEAVTVWASHLPL